MVKLVISCGLGIIYSPSDTLGLGQDAGRFLRFTQVVTVALAFILDPCLMVELLQFVSMGFVTQREQGGNMFSQVPSSFQGSLWLRPTWATCDGSSFLAWFWCSPSLLWLGPT